MCPPLSSLYPAPEPGFITAGRSTLFVGASILEGEGNIKRNIPQGNARSGTENPDAIAMS